VRKSTIPEAMPCESPVTAPAPAPGLGSEELFGYANTWRLKGWTSRTRSQSYRHLSAVQL